MRVNSPYAPKGETGFAWRRSRPFGAGYGPYSKCQLCGHDQSKHFWWDSPAGSVLGCPDCRDDTCENRAKEVGTNMSSVNLCERCDSLMLAKAVASLDLFASPNANLERVEICPACMEDLRGFLAEHPVRDKRTYREPYSAQESNVTKALEAGGLCGASSPDGDYLCLKGKGHEGKHRDGDEVWT